MYLIFKFKTTLRYGILYLIKFLNYYREFLSHLYAPQILSINQLFYFLFSLDDPNLRVVWKGDLLIACKLFQEPQSNF